MRKLFFIPILLFSLLLGTTSYAGDWSKDLNKGLNAASNGDFATALKKFKPLAEQGHMFAQFYLGVMYGLGQGVPQDDKEAVRWYRLAAEQGLADAQSNLGIMYQKGLDTNNLSIKLAKYSKGKIEPISNSNDKVIL